MLPLTWALSGCASPPPAGLRVPNTPLVAAGAPPVDARQLIAAAPLTVFVFFSRDCHCLTVHEARLRDLYATYQPRGVQIVMVDPEVRATPEIDAAEATRRGYPFRLFIDRGARLADALDAQYATYSVVVNREGRVLYRGGIDSDKSHLHNGSTPYLRDALDDLLSGRPARLGEAKTLGCSLEKW
ncbi:MAG: redoxin family protein [Polyangiaceae bacterium]